MSSPSSEYLCFLEMSVQDRECLDFFTKDRSIQSLLVSEDRLEEDEEEEEEEEAEDDTEEKDEEEPVDELDKVCEHEVCWCFCLCW